MVEIILKKYPTIGEWVGNGRAVHHGAYKAELAYGRPAPVDEQMEDRMRRDEQLLESADPKGRC